jgi:hypothetical protein
MWIGGSQAIDMHPTSISSIEHSEAIGIDGNYQCGTYIDTGGLTHACMWSRTAASFKPLVTPGFEKGVPTAIDSTNVLGNTVFTVGWAGPHNPSVDEPPQAVYWKGYAQVEPAKRLTPTGFTESVALAVDYPLIGGYFQGPSTFTYRQAALWNVATG